MNSNLRIVQTIDERGFDMAEYSKELNNDINNAEMNNTSLQQ